MCSTAAAPQGKYNPLPAPAFNGNKTLLECQWRELAFAVPKDGVDEALEMEYTLGQGAGAGKGQGAAGRLREGHRDPHQRSHGISRGRAVNMAAAALDPGADFSMAPRRLRASAGADAGRRLHGPCRCAGTPLYRPPGCPVARVNATLAPSLPAAADGASWCAANGY